MYDELKTFVFGAASVSHDVDMDDDDAIAMEDARQRLQKKQQRRQAREDKEYSADAARTERARKPEDTVIADALRRNGLLVVEDEEARFGWLVLFADR